MIEAQIKPGSFVAAIHTGEVIPLQDGVTSLIRDVPGHNPVWSEGTPSIRGDFMDAVRNRPNHVRLEIASVRAQDDEAKVVEVFKVAPGGLW